MHPTTINGFSPKEIAQSIYFMPSHIQEHFLYSLAQDLKTQTEKDEEKGYTTLVTLMTKAAQELEEATSIDVIVSSSILAEQVGNLQYDAMIDFLETYSQLTKNVHVLKAKQYVEQAWEKTPESWKEKYAQKIIK